MVVEGFDWGPGVTKLIIKLDKEVKAGAVSAGDFTVTVSRKALDWTTFQPTVAEETRKVTAAYVSAEDGAPASDKSSFVTVEMTVGPPDTGSPFYFYINLNKGEMSNSWADPYEYKIVYSGSALESFKVEGKAAAKVMPLADKFYTTGKFTASDGVSLQYASYAPPADAAKKPLLIWLHGMGEGSSGGASDPTVVLLGNRVTQLVNTEIQTLMGGAYVLAPQAPTMWMDDGESRLSMTGATIYLTALTELIKKYINENPAIDTSRVYIGGCSNGGYMTMKMILTYPDMFAAAYPICEAYLDAAITDTQIESIKHMPIWFTQAKSDATVKYDKHAVPTYKRLIKAGAKDAHLSLFDTVVDTSGLYKDAAGAPYKYDGHFSWIYALNNECVIKAGANEVTLFRWMAAKTKTNPL